MIWITAISQALSTSIKLNDHFSIALLSANLELAGSLKAFSSAALVCCNDHVMGA
jgi:hypothetical protein